jgi:hypothetical protein
MHQHLIEVHGGQEEQRETRSRPAPTTAGVFVPQQVLVADEQAVLPVVHQELAHGQNACSTTSTTIAKTITDTMPGKALPTTK